jgi:hypothetical protein
MLSPYLRRDQGPWSRPDGGRRGPGPCAAVSQAAPRAPPGQGTARRSARRSPGDPPGRGAAIRPAVARVIRNLRPGPGTVDTRRGSGKLLPQSSTWLAVRVSWPSGARLRAGRLTGPDARRSAPGRARQPAGPGGWKREGPGAPSRQRRTSSLPAGRSPVRRETRALFPGLPQGCRCVCLPSRPPGRPGPRLRQPSGDRAIRGREPGPRSMPSVNFRAILAMPLVPGLR